jgi:hypothetical protein
VLLITIAYTSAGLKGRRWNAQGLKSMTTFRSLLATLLRHVAIGILLFIGSLSPALMKDLKTCETRLCSSIEIAKLQLPFVSWNWCNRIQFLINIIGITRRFICLVEDSGMRYFHNFGFVTPLPEQEPNFSIAPIG